MSKRYTGGVVSSSLPTVNAAGASGVFLLSQQADAQSRNAWPPYKIEKSLRFRSAASGYLNRTPAVASNQKTFTISFWAKIGNLGTYRSFFSAGTANPPFVDISLQNTDEFMVDMSVTAGRVSPKTTALFRDPSAWYHFVVAFDTTQATQANRVKVYVNGVEQTLSALGVAQNTDLAVNSAVAHNLGRRAVASDSYHEGYMSEVYFVDGQALTPSSFGATDKDGNWSPIAYTGAYGTNGFYLNFKDNTSATTMGYDYSGNGNNWTLNGFNVSTANTTYDIMIDVPEDQDGVSVRGNYATLNSLDPKNGTQSNGNLTHAMGSNDYAAARSTIGMKGGKWYWEAKCETTLQSNYYMGIGVTADGDYSGYNYIGSTSGGYSYDGRALKLNNGSSSSYGASYTLNDIIGVALDLDNGTIEYYKNGASQGVAYTGIDTTRTYYAAHWIYTTQISYNFGQQPLAYTLPTGFKTLNTFNLPEPTIKQPNKHFDATLYTGNNGTLTVTGVAFQPDFLWFKRRSGVGGHGLYNSLTTLGSSLNSNGTGVEIIPSPNDSLTAINSNGFTLGPNNNSGAQDINYTSAATYVAWLWNAGGSTVTNTTGTISSQVRANPTAGFSVVTYTASSSASTIGHGLGVAPSMIIQKNRDAVTDWGVYHISIGATKFLKLNDTAAAATNSVPWNDTAPTSTVFSIGTGYTNGNKYVAYCFTPIAGYSAFGSYTGNANADGPFVFTGFRPRFVMWKNSSAAEAWLIEDTARSTFNQVALELYPSSSGAEAAGSSRSPTQQFDFLSNGFKVRGAQEQTNGSGNTIIYAAFAEAPFKYARSR